MKSAEFVDKFKLHVGQSARPGRYDLCRCERHTMKQIGTVSYTSVELNS